MNQGGLRAALFISGALSLHYANLFKSDPTLRTKASIMRMILTDLMTATAAKKSRTPRQELLSVVMKEISGEAGEEIAQAYVKGKSDKVAELLGAAVERIAKKCAKKK